MLQKKFNKTSLTALAMVVCVAYAPPVCCDCCYYPVNSSLWTQHDASAGGRYGGRLVVTSVTVLHHGELAWYFPVPEPSQHFKGIRHQLAQYQEFASNQRVTYYHE